jgi:non-specific protein-tyrosine kinase
MENIDLQEYIAPLRKWWWLLVAATLLAALSALAYLLTQPDTYESRSTLMIGSGVQALNPDNNQLYTAQKLAETYADIAKRGNIQQATMDALGFDWLPQYSVSVVPNTQILEIVVIDSEPTRAQLVAAELVNQLILLSPVSKQTSERSRFVSEQLQKLENSIRITEDKIAQQEQLLTKLLSAREIAAARDELNALSQKLASMQGTYTALLNNTQRGAVNSISVLEPASLPMSPIDSKLPLNVVVAALLGCVLAAGAAYVIEYLDNTVKSSEQIKRDLALNTLGAIPNIPFKSEAENRLVMLNSQSSAASEAFRILRTNLQFSSIDRPLHKVLITSPSPSEGKSFTSANLSVALARTGKRVILVDTDLHRPSQHRLFHQINHSGLTNALLGDHGSLDALLRPTPVEGLRLLTTGPLPPNPSELLSTQRMRDILAELSEMADIVLLDSPPVTVVADTASLSTDVDGVIMVLNVRSTTRDSAKRAVAALQQVKARLLGVLLNGVSNTNTGYHYHYTSGYEKGYYRDGDSGKKVKGAGQAADAAPMFNFAASRTFTANGSKSNATLDGQIRPRHPS